MTRPEIVGPDTLEAPFPVVADTHVLSGHGRGSTELGFPTANIPPGELEQLDPGIYFGWASVQANVSEDGQQRIQEMERQNKADSEHTSHRPDFDFGAELGAAEHEVFPMVMSIGYNPFYKNKTKSAEVHIVHDFKCKFYGARAQVAVLGFIRNEKSYDSLDALIEDIHTDIRVALKSLERPAYQEAKKLV